MLKYIINRILVELNFVFVQCTSVQGTVWRVDIKSMFAKGNVHLPFSNWVVVNLVGLALVYKLKMTVFYWEIQVNYWGMVKNIVCIIASIVSCVLCPFFRHNLKPGSIDGVAIPGNSIITSYLSFFVQND